MEDTRIVHGIHCVWWNDIDKVAKTLPSHDGISLPCCPHCGSMLMEVDNPKIWWSWVEKHQTDGHPGYRDFVEWMKGKCFPDMQSAKNDYEKTGRKVTL